MSDHPAHNEIKTHLKAYGALFAAQVVGIVIAVTAYYLKHPGIAVVAAAILLVGSVAGGIVLHQVSRKKTLPALLMVTAFFVITLILLSVLAFHDHPLATVIYK